MWNLKNGGGYPAPGNQNPKPFVPPEMWSAPYPSLVCMQCQERSMMQPVLPSAPYPMVSDSEDAIHLVSPYNSRTMSTNIRENEKFVAPSGRISRNTFPGHIADVQAAATYHDVKSLETRIGSPEAENAKEKSKGTYCSQAYWIKVAVMVLLILAGVMFLTLIPQKL